MTPILTTAAVNSPSNLPELTTEKLSLTNKSLLSSRLVSESLTSGSTNVSHNSTNNHSLSNSSSTHHAKSTNKQRTSSNSLIKSSTGGGMRVNGQKIEMPHLNDFFDHSAYLKKHEHGFRWEMKKKLKAFMEIWQNCRKKLKKALNLSRICWKLLNKSRKKLLSF